MNRYSEFPSLSNNAQSSSNQGSMWSAGNASSRNFSGTVQRNQSTPLSNQHTGQEDMFSPASSRLGSAQNAFRFNSQGNTQQPPSQAPPSSVDDFPPLNRRTNGEIGSERGVGLMSSLGFGSQNAGQGGPAPPARGNGLLNALSANHRTNEARGPAGLASPGDIEPLITLRLIAFLNCE